MTILSVVEDCPTDKTRESISFFWFTLPRKPWKISIEKYFIKNLHLLKGKSIQDCPFLKLEHFVKSLNWVWRYWLKNERKNVLFRRYELQKFSKVLVPRPRSLRDYEKKYSILNPYASSILISATMWIIGTVVQCS